MNHTRYRSRYCIRIRRSFDNLGINYSVMAFFHLFGKIFFPMKLEKNSAILGKI